MSQPLHEIQKVLVLSTCHITEDTDELLREGKVPNLVIPYEEGYFLWAPSLASELSDDIPGELKFLLGYARGCTCQWLRLDCDGPERDDLAKWEW